MAYMAIFTGTEGTKAITETMAKRKISEYRQVHRWVAILLQKKGKSGKVCVPSGGLHLYSQVINGLIKVPFRNQSMRPSVAVHTCSLST